MRDAAPDLELVLGLVVDWRWTQRSLAERRVSRQLAGAEMQAPAWAPPVVLGFQQPGSWNHYALPVGFWAESMTSIPWIPVPGMNSNS